MNGYDKTISEIRKFNLFYTVNMGFLDSAYLDTEYSMAEIRILFEIKSYNKCIQSELAKVLHIDRSFLSRIVNRLYRNGLIRKDNSGEDKRATYISLTGKGVTERENLIKLINIQIENKINNLSVDECNKLCDAMDTIISILGKGG